MPPRGHQLGLLWGGIVVLAIAASPWAETFAGMSGMFCPFKEWTGIPCPGCGTTRSALALARFDVLEAFVRYPLQSSAWTFFVVGGLVAGALSLGGRPLPHAPRRLPRWGSVLAVMTILANWGYCIATGV